VLNVKKKKPRRKALLLGLGLDSDGHKRLTKGPNFALVGGSEETHEAMTEKAIKINEKLASRGSSSKTSAAKNSMTSRNRSACAGRMRSEERGQPCPQPGL
jgi:hypothetical protein